MFKIWVSQKKLLFFASDINTICANYRLIPFWLVEQSIDLSFLLSSTGVPLLEISSNTSTRGMYGVGVGPLVQKQPVGKLTVGRHSKPRIFKIWKKKLNHYNHW